MIPMTREPAVAGQFYPFEKTQLDGQLKKFFSEAKVTSKNALAGIAPHAGYVYSGPTAAYFYKSIQAMKPETIVIIGPNHTGFGSGIDIYPDGTWKTPLGEVEIDDKIAKKIEGTMSKEAHMMEHSVEVQIPFLQFAFKHKFKIVPVCVMDQNIETMKTLGENLSKVLDPKKDFVIASTDFSHYVPQKQAYENDFKAIDTIKKLDIKALYKIKKEFDVTMCGYGPIAATITYAKAVGAKTSELLKYSTSGDVTGDFSSVVGYGALAFY